MTCLPEGEIGRRLDRVQQRPGGRSARTRAQVLKAVQDELLVGGYQALSHRTVARRAGVDPATVYRRWPTRSALATDALLEAARGALSVPDTGSLDQDLTAFLATIVHMTTVPSSRRLFQALGAVGLDADGDLAAIVHDFWHTWFLSATRMFTRAVDRGEIGVDIDRHSALEQLVAPIYFRLFVSGEPADPKFVPRCVRSALLTVGYPVS